MKVIRNKLIPFKGFAAINLFGVLFIKNDTKITKRLLNHEGIHSEQMKEMLYVFFYIWYFIEWIIRLCIDYKTAYRNISFERESYDNELNDSYIKNRKRYNWIKYIKQ